MNDQTDQMPANVSTPPPTDPAPIVEIDCYNWKAATPNLNRALALARGEFPPIPKTKVAKVYKKDNPSVLLYTFKFADLADVMEAVKVSLAKHELAITHTTGPGREGVVLETFLRHSSGEMLRSLMPMPFMEGRPQDWGSLLTYLRRYLVSALLGVASDEDDDGNAAQGNPNEITDNAKKGSGAKGKGASSSAAAPPAPPPETPPAEQKSNLKQNPTDPSAFILPAPFGDLAGKRIDQCKESALKKALAWAQAELKKTPPPRSAGDLIASQAAITEFFRDVGVQT